ncbi:hypothetical protein MRB53_021202 [Persea americana]|uniref:Uncharacterized protein n=1 Tax=Persea americana TaxID=3435 RepID=A0ACC2L3I3_PERAE|nr:hypothetical protein MRB53_021202 [Persea americana]
MGSSSFVKARHGNTGFRRRQQPPSPATGKAAVAATMQQKPRFLSLLRFAIYDGPQEIKTDLFSATRDPDSSGRLLRSFARRRLQSQNLHSNCIAASRTKIWLGFYQWPTL